MSTPSQAWLALVRARREAIPGDDCRLRGRFPAAIGNLCVAERSYPHFLFTSPWISLLPQSGTPRLKALRRCVGKIRHSPTRRQTSFPHVAGEHEAKIRHRPVVQPLMNQRRVGYAPGLFDHDAPGIGQVQFSQHCMQCVDGVAPVTEDTRTPLD